MDKTLFADSGGTGTDWGYLDSDGNKVIFGTESYHPVNWGDSFWTRIESFWKSNQHLLEYSIRFFGAGCLNKEIATQLENKFKSFGFKEVSVQSDLHAAGFSSVQNGQGTVLISGTGSVLFDFNNGEVSNIVGGKGHVLGDEGSGFYFGKLIIEKYKKGNLTPEQLAILKEKVDIEALSLLPLSEAKFDWAELSRILKDCKIEFEDIHLENINKFIKTHFESGIFNSICLVGSYTYLHKSLWVKVLASNNCEVEAFVLKPIKYFIE